MAVRELVTLGECLAYLGKAANITDKELALLSVIKPAVEKAIREELRCGLTQNTYTDYLPSGNAQDITINAIRYRNPFQGGGSMIQLAEIPVRRIVSVYSQSSAYAGRAVNAWGAASLFVQGQDYYLDEDFPGFSRSGLLVGIRASWPAYPRSVKVTYVAGYSQREMMGDCEHWKLDARNLRMGVLMTIAANFSAQSTGATSGKLSAASVSANGGKIVSERLADYSVTYAYNSELKSGSVGTPSVIDAVFIPARAADLLGPFKNMAGSVM